MSNARLGRAVRCSIVLALACWLGFAAPGWSADPTPEQIEALRRRAQTLYEQGGISKKDLEDYLKQVDEARLKELKSLRTQLEK